MHITQNSTPNMPQSQPRRKGKKSRPPTLLAKGKEQTGVSAGSFEHAKQSTVSSKMAEEYNFSQERDLMKQLEFMRTQGPFIVTQS